MTYMQTTATECIAVCGRRRVFFFFKKEKKCLELACLDVRAYLCVVEMHACSEQKKKGQRFLKGRFTVSNWESVKNRCALCFFTTLVILKATYGLYMVKGDMQNRGIE